MKRQLIFFLIAFLSLYCFSQSYSIYDFEDSQTQNISNYDNWKLISSQSTDNTSTDCPVSLQLLTPVEISLVNSVGNYSQQNALVFNGLFPNQYGIASRLNYENWSTPNLTNTKILILDFVFDKNGLSNNLMMIKNL